MIGGGSVVFGTRMRIYMHVRARALFFLARILMVYLMCYLMVLVGPFGPIDWPLWANGSALLGKWIGRFGQMDWPFWADGVYLCVIFPKWNTKVLI